MKRVKKILHAFPVNKFIGNFITNGLTDIPKIINESFADEVFLSVSSSVKSLLIWNDSINTN
jgi:hypothetical protein